MSIQDQRTAYRLACTLCIAGFFILPIIVSAQVRINEVAWMGDERSYTNEWIELYNASGASVDMSGWRIETADGSITVSLDGMLAAGGFYLLERTDDNTVPEAAADQIYAGSLANDGNTLKLLDAGGAVMHEVLGGDGWESIGGDNDTKNTAQNTGSRWITAPGTPASANKTRPAESSDDAEDTDSGSDTDSGNSSTGASSPTPHDPASYRGESSDSESQSTYTQPELTVQAAADRTVTAGANVILQAQARPESDFLKYNWNLGNGAEKSGKQIWYIYPRPGRYLVTVSATDGDEHATDQFVINAIAADITIPEANAGTQGFIELANNTNTRIDLSGWHLRAGGDFYTLPKNTYLLAGESTVYPASATDLAFEDASSVALVYPNGSVATRYESPQESQNAGASTAGPAQTRAASPASERPSAETSSRSDTRPPSDEESSNDGEASTTTNTAAAAGAETGSSNLFLWMSAFVGVLIAAAGAIIALAPAKQEEKDDLEQLAAEFEIIEESE